jgi:hypothetical protein
MYGLLRYREGQDTENLPRSVDRTRLRALSPADRDNKGWGNKVLLSLSF